MAKKQMKTPGAPAATKNPRSYGRQTMGSTATSRVDDASAKDVKSGSLRRKKNAPSGVDPSAGTARSRSRSATNASAQFRISVSHKAPQPDPKMGTQANGRLVPSVMGSKQNFAQEASYKG